MNIIRVQWLHLHTVYLFDIVYPSAVKETNVTY